MKNLRVLFLFLFFGVSCSQSDEGFAPGSTVVISAPSDPRSCLDWQPFNPSSGIYTIDPDGLAGPNSAMQVYCDMTTSGGGWTLVMKQRSNDGVTLQGDTAYWTNSGSAPLSDISANLNTSDQNFVSAAFTKVSVNQMMLVASNEAIPQTRVGAAASAYAAFAATPTDYSDDVNAIRPNWNIVTSVYPNGSALTGARFGFNIRQRTGGSTYCATRWGWTANQDGAGASLGSADSCGGLGAYGVQYGGTFMNNSKNAWQPATLLLYVK